MTFHRAAADPPAPPRILALWSAPRCRSTAFFRLMLQRGDFQALHEPFSVLAELGESTVGGVTVRSEPELLRAIRALSASVPVFFKDTTDERYPGVLADKRFLGTDAVHAFLIRHPRLTIPSYHALNPSVRRDQIGFAHLYELFRAVIAQTGRVPCVVDAEELVRRPAAMVRAFCAAVGIRFVAEALRWEAGDRPEWAPTARWHRQVSRTDRLLATSGRPGVVLDEHPVLRDYLAYHLPFFAALHRCRLRA